MLWLRSFLYNFIFYTINCPTFIVFSPALLLPKDLFRYVPRTWCLFNTYLLKYVVGLTYRITGKEYISKTPVIYAMKHQSAWETLAMGHILKWPAIVLKKQLMNIPFFGWYLKHTNMIPIDRRAGSKSLRDMVTAGKKVIENNRPILIFPEGTRTLPGHTRKYQAGVYFLYKQLNIPVVPVAHNAGLFWKRRHFYKYPGTITLAFLPPIQPGLSRDAFMSQLETAIETTSQQLIKAGEKKCD